MKNSGNIYDNLVEDEELNLPPKLDIAQLKKEPPSNRDLLQQLVEEKANDWSPREIAPEEMSLSRSVSERNMRELDLAREVELDLDSLDKVLNLKQEGIKYYAKSHFVEALGRFEDALKMLPGDLELMYYHGLCCFRLRNYKRAYSAFQEISKLDAGGTIPQLPKMTALCLIRQKQYAKAEEYLKDVLANKKRDNQLMNLLGFVLERQDKLQEAEAVIRSILNNEPENTNACNSMAWLLYRQDGNLTDAINYVRQALLHEPENPAYLDTLGMLYMKQGNLDLATQTLKKALSLDPGNEDILTHISAILKI